MTGNYTGTTYPYVELALPSSITIPGGNRHLHADHRPQPEGHRGRGLGGPRHATEFVLTTVVNVPITGTQTAVFDGYPTTGSSGTPPKAAPTALLTTTVVATAQTVSFTSSAPTGAVVGGATTRDHGLVRDSPRPSPSTRPRHRSVRSPAAWCVPGVGTCTLDGNQAGNATTAPHPRSSNPSPSPGPRRSSFTSTAPAAATVGGATYTPTATATSGLTPAITVDARPVGVLDHRRRRELPGRRHLHPRRQPGREHLLRGRPPGPQSFTVFKATQTISFTSTAPPRHRRGTHLHAHGQAHLGSRRGLHHRRGSTAGACAIAGGVVSFTGVGQLHHRRQPGRQRHLQRRTPGPADGHGLQGHPTITPTTTAPTGATVGGATYTPRPPPPRASPWPSPSTPRRSVCSITAGVVSYRRPAPARWTSTRPATAPTPPLRRSSSPSPWARAPRRSRFTSTAPATPPSAGPPTRPRPRPPRARGGLHHRRLLDRRCLLDRPGAVSFTGVGQAVSIDANQAGNANYNAAAQVQQTCTVSKGRQTITPTSTAPTGATVGGATYTPTATASSGLTVAISIDVSSSSVARSWGCRELPGCRHLQGRLQPGG